MTLVNRIGRIMRKHTPSLYYFIIKNLARLNKKDSIYIIDYLGGSFKKYILDNSMPDKLSNLLSGMDEHSIHTVNVIYTRILNYPDKSYNIFIDPKKNEIIGGLLYEEKIKLNRTKIKKEQSLKIEKKYIESSVFHYFHGLSLLSEEAKKYLNEGDFIDIGAYVGDSALALKKYNYKKIYSIDISKRSIGKYIDTMKKNRIDSSKYNILNYAVAAKPGLPPLKIADSGSAGLSLKSGTSTKDYEIEVERKTLDEIVNKFSIQPVFIKLDIEGAGMDCILGGLNTIRKFRPILSIAIYHNPVEFFELKPFLETEIPNYRFMIRKIENQTKNNFCHAETILMAYPTEIISN